MAASEAAKDVDPPKRIKFDTIVMDVCCHPARDMVAVGDIDGEVSVYSYSTSVPSRQLMSFNHHKKSCRCVRFNADGGRLVTGSKDKSISVIDMASGAVIQTVNKAHESAIFCMLLVDDNIAATGDDDGNLKVWDFRQQRAVMEVRESDEYLTDLAVDRTKRLLLATSGEGTLSAFDIRKHKMVVQSELLDSGLLSLAIVKNGSKVVCGSDEGVIDIFNWGEWGNISDRFPGHPMSIDAIVPITDSIVCTGASDGIIRAVSVHPNRIIGILGRHDDGFPVEALSKSHCGQWLASCSHDQCVEFSDLRRLSKLKIDGHKRLKRTAQGKALSASAAAGGADFFDGLGGPSSSDVKETESGSSDDDDSDKADSDDSDSSDSDSDNESEDSIDQSGKDERSKDGESGSDSKNDDGEDDDDDDENTVRP